MFFFKNNLEHSRPFVAHLNYLLFLVCVLKVLEMALSVCPPSSSRRLRHLLIRCSVFYTVTKEIDLKQAKYFH